MTASATATGAVLVPTLPTCQVAPAEATTLLQDETPGGSSTAQCGGPTALDDEERAPTLKWLPAIFFGVPVPPFPADKPLPAHVALGSTDATRLERSPRPVSR